MVLLNRQFAQACNSISKLYTQRVAALAVMTVLIAGCSGGGSSDPEPNANNSNSGNATTDNINNDAATTQVTFDITVPAYSSNALQVNLSGNNKSINASWVIDETWRITEPFPSQTTQPITISFNDNNGALVLATYSADVQIGASGSQTIHIRADQFDSKSWDADSDGTSNLQEAINGTKPAGGANAPGPVQATLELVPDKTIRLSWQASSGTEFYRVLENPDGVSGFTPISGDLTATTEYFDHRVALFNHLNASYIVQACNSTQCTDSIEQSVPSSIEEAITYVKGGNTGIWALFGMAVTLTHDGNMMAIGASGEDGENNNTSASGAVYLFERINSAWQQTHYLRASNAQAGDGFGTSLGLSDDGNTLAVGAPWEDSWVADLDDNVSGHETNYGAVYIFHRNNGKWEQHTYLKPPYYHYRGGYGSRLSLSADGKTLAVDAKFDSTSASGINGDTTTGLSAHQSGAVHIYVRSGDTWSQQAHIKASYPGAGHYDQDGELQTGDNFGNFTSLSHDGNTLAVGAVYEDSNATGINGDQQNNDARGSGAVYIFKRTGTNWQQQAYIKASNAGVWDYFGHTLSLDGDGDRLAVFALGEDSSAIGINGDQANNDGRDSGALYLFSYTNGSWQQDAYIKPGTDDSDLRQLSARALTRDGNLLAYGSTLYRNQNGAWQLYNDLQNHSGQAKAYTGRAVLSGDGSTLAIGDTNDESSATGFNGDRYDYFAEHAGAVYLY